MTGFMQRETDALNATRKGHVWETYADTDEDYADSDYINLFAYSRGQYCNGPRCTVCGYGYCKHHYPEGPPKPCAKA